MHPLTPVDSKAISVVIQGPLCRDLSPDRNIFACIASIRKHLPNAEIVVATWRHEDLAGVEADQTIVLDDPGCFLDDSGNQINTNRMLYSTSSGIQVATRPYVMKLRADHNLASAALAVIGTPEPAGPGEPRLFKTPITLTTLFIRRPERVPMLFHISDLVQFGTRETMLAFWQQPLLKREDIFNPEPRCNPFGNFSGFTSARMVVEQSIMLGALGMHGIDIRLTHPCQASISHLKIWDAILSHNFRVLDFAEAGIDFPERFLNSGFSLDTLYKAPDIEQLRHLDSMSYRRRMLRIWCNQYLLSFLRPGWWVSSASIILFSLSPTLARNARSYWRRLRKLVHPGSDRT